MSNEANPGLLPSQEQMFEMIRFNDYVKDNMVPIKEIVLGPKRMSQKDRDLGRTGGRLTRSLSLCIFS